MKLVIDSPILLHHFDDCELFKECSIWFEHHGDRVLVKAQTITLPCDVMEDVLDTIYFGIEGSVTLYRYEHGRCKLKIETGLELL